MSSPIALDGGAVAPTKLVVQTVGRQARRLADADKGARVIARFERSAYLCSPDGKIACVGGEGLGFGPLNALVGTAEFKVARLAVGDRVLFDIEDAVPWRPRAFPEPSLEGIGKALALLAATLDEVAPRGIARAASDDPIDARAQRGLAALTTWLARRGNSDLPGEVMAMIGLGPGLTPAGDDALGGAMIALKAFGRPKATAWLASQVLPLAVALTSSISLAHLEAAAEGEGAAALHDTLAALAARDAAAVVDGLRQLDRIGHSSGWDALAGARAALMSLR